MNPSGSTSTASSDVRPRQRRLRPSSGGTVARYGDGNDREPDAVFVSPFSSPRPSRTASPVPRPQISGSKPPGRGATTLSRSPSNGLMDRWQAFRTGQQASSTLVSGLWGGSWSAIQGLASTVLNGDVDNEGRGRPNTGFRPYSQDASSEANQNRWFGGVTGPSKWGPEPAAHRPEDTIATGTRQYREALTWAKRRDDLLTVHEPALADTLGNFKRRVSDDRGVTSSSTFPVSPAPAAHEQDLDGEELVYLHHVKPHDTVAGVVIQFHCQPAIFRKANRFWPNDPIQSRQTVVLPVHACSIKSRPAPLMEEGSRRGIRSEEELPGQADIQQSSPQRPNGQRRRGSSTSSLDLPELQDDTPWQHDSWILIEGQPEPVEIVRMPRRILGYFPPRRRKSSRSSEVDDVSMSLDLPRSLAGQTNRNKSRSDSTASFFAQHLHGPGGVGPLSAGTKNPGPSQDRLNRYLGPHLPKITPPRDSFESVSSNVSGGLENVGSAIEGWVKRVATRAAAALAENSGGVVTGCRASGEGDLIELSDGLDNRGSEDGPGLPGRATSTATTAAGQGIDADMERALRERFPMRGRSGGVCQMIPNVRKAIERCR